jgi:hypothetical protein
MVIAFTIPFITFTTYAETSSGTSNFFVSEIIASEANKTTNYVPVVLWSIYLIGLLFFGVKFFRNLGDLILKIYSNPKVKINRIINVLLQETIVPHTFFSFIFLNKQKYESQEIPEAILIHERAHAQQKHSLDILLIEVLQIVFWFNPLIYLIKHSIKLNHEFLADQTVLRNGVPKTNYQNLLVAYSSYDTPQLANSINYSSIKKRITVMKTQTSKRSTLLRTLVLLPLLALLVFGFSSREVVPKEAPSPTLTSNQEYTSQKQESQEKATREQVREYNKLARKYNTMDKENMFIKKNDVERIKYLYGLMSTKQRKNAEAFPKFPPPPKAPKAPKTVKAPKTIKTVKAKTVKPAKTVKAIKPIKAPKAPKSVKVVKGVNDMDSDVPPPPPPIVRKEPLDHIVRMAYENAAFFYEGKSISSDKAIAIFKKNKNLNVETAKFKNSNPIVKITKEGVTSKK